MNIDIYARETFKKALVKAGKIRFHGGYPGLEMEKPVAIHVCKSKRCCNIGSSCNDCAHRFIIKRIPFCIY